MLYLISHQRAYRKLQREIDAVVSEGQVAGGVSLARARQMPYLQAVIREGLRLWPPAVNIFPRDVPAGGDTVLLDGKEVYLPPGCCIGYSAWAMHRSTEIYGDDADAFRPERWFEKDEARLARMTRTNDLVFGYGNFHCLGKPIAQLELSKGIFAVCCISFSFFFSFSSFSLITPRTVQRPEDGIDEWRVLWRIHSS